MSGIFRALSVRGKTLSGVRCLSTQVSVLSNKVRVVTYPTEDPTATVSVSVEGGSASETSKTSGSANFLEHLLLKANQRSEEELQKAIEKTGSLYSSSTRREQTLISLKSSPNHVSTNVGILGELIKNTNISDKAVEAARQIILEGNDQLTQNTRQLVLDNMHASAYQESSLGLPISGLSENIRSITAKDLQAYASNYYRPEHVSVIGVGNVQHDALVRAVEQGLNLSNPSSQPQKRTPSQTPYIGSMVTVQNDYLPAATYAIGLKGVGLHHPDYLALCLLAYAFHPTYDRNVAGGLAISPRYSRIVAEEQQVHYVEPFNHAYSDAGIFGVLIESGADKPFDAVWEILNNYHRVTHNLTNAELSRAKALYRSQLIKNETPGNITDSISRLNLREGQTRKSLKDRLKELDALTLEQVQETFDEYTNDIEPTISAYGSLLHFPDYNYIRSWTSWRRL